MDLSPLIKSGGWDFKNPKTDLDPWILHKRSNRHVINLEGPNDALTRHRLLPPSSSTSHKSEEKKAIDELRSSRATTTTSSNLLK
ncbi:hypothetical protein A2U01_0061225, partial [Trifolium medium]|nr:hypothetical protein [Trifolium medium]